jgi:muramidase (phage lysozyme)
MYTIVESGTKGIEPINSYEDLEKHHPSKKKEPKRKYDELDGHLEEVRTDQPGSRRLIKKDFILLVSGSNNSIEVPCPVAGFVKTFKSYGTVKIYSTEKYDDLLGQVLHLDTNFKVKDGQYVEYGQPIGIQYKTDGQGKPTYAIHTHAELERDQFKKYINDIINGTIKPGSWPSNSSQGDEQNYQLPIRKSDGSHYQPEELYKALEQETSGHYLLGNHGFWHGGIHISEKSAPQCKHKEPVRCIADGEVVAYRLNNSYLASTFQGDSECTSLQYSTSFCLVRHQYESPKRAPVTSAKPKINWVGRNIQIASNRNARDVAAKTLGITGNFECLMPAGTELQILKVQDEQGDGYHFANAKLIKGVLNGKDKTGSPVSLTVGSDVWFAAFDKKGDILKASDKSEIFTDITPAPLADTEPASTQPETNTLSFFSLYMHLLPYEQYPNHDNQANRRLTIKASDLNVRQEANLTGEPLGHITRGAEVEVLSSSADYRKQPADTTTYELAQVKILSKEVKKAGQQTAKVGDIVWLALSKTEAGKPALHYTHDLPKNTLTRPSYWKGQVKARLSKRLPAFNNATDADNQRIGLLAENSVLEYHTSSLKRVPRNGQQQLMAECRIISGGFWDKAFCPAGPIWVSIDKETAELTPETPCDFDSVVISSTPIKAGDPIGYLGLYETPRSAKGGKNSLHQVHVEVFTDDAKLESFLKNPAGISSGRKYVRASKGKPLYNKTGTEQQPIFTASGQLLSENYCAAQEQIKRLKGSDGKEWYCLKINTGSSTADAYIAKPDAEVISQHDWEKLGFQIIKETNGNADGFLDPEATPDFYQSLYQQIDQLGNQDGKVTPDEISRALKDHKLRDRWSKLIGYHPTEWQAKSDEPKWQKMNGLLKDAQELLRHEKERIDNLVFWDEMSGAMQVGLPKQVHHFHPLAFINNLQSSGGKSGWAHSAFAKLLGKVESNNDYTAYNRTYQNPKRVESYFNTNLTKMTIAQVMAKQSNGDMFATGRFQIVTNTLKEAVNSLNLDVSLMYDEDMQDKIFNEYLITKKRPAIIKYLEDGGTVEDAIYAWAMEFASAGVRAGKEISPKNIKKIINGEIVIEKEKRYAKGGESYYSGDGYNNAHITPDEMTAALEESKNEK